MTELATLLGPTKVGGMAIANRVVLAPMTRSRSNAFGVVPDYAAQYYSERAAAQGGAGLLITEGTQSSFINQGYVRTPGIHTIEQVVAWRRVTQAVHAQGGRIFLQIMNCGRVTSHYNRATEDLPIAPSAIRADGQIHTDAAGMQPHDMPRALALGEIPDVIFEHELAARNAMLAGFDGLELHAMGPYLPVTFLSSNSNQRTDAYGGSVARRLRFVVEVLEAMARGAGGADRIGIRISPGFAFFGIDDENPELLYNSLAEAIAPLGLAHLHVLDMTRIVPPAGVDFPTSSFDFLPGLRRRFPGTLIASGNFDAAAAQAAIASGRADLISFGKPFIRNPDLATAFAEGRTLIETDPAFHYSAGPEGYIDTKPAALAA